MAPSLAVSVCYVQHVIYQQRQLYSILYNSMASMGAVVVCKKVCSYMMCNYNDVIVLLLHAPRSAIPRHGTGIDSNI